MAFGQLQGIQEVLCVHILNPQQALSWSRFTKLNVLLFAFYCSVCGCCCCPCSSPALAEQMSVKDLSVARVLSMIQYIHITLMEWQCSYLNIHFASLVRNLKPELHMCIYGTTYKPFLPSLCSTPVHNTPSAFEVNSPVVVGLSRKTTNVPVAH